MGWPRRRAKRTADLKVWPPLPMPTAEEEAAAGHFLAARVAELPGGREALAEARQRRAAELEGSRRQEHLTVPDTGQGPRHGETVGQFLRRTPHEFVRYQGLTSRAGACLCGEYEQTALHHGDGLFATYPYLCRATGWLNERAAAGDDVPEPVADAPADFGAQPAEAGPVLSAGGWLAGAVEEARREAAGRGLDPDGQPVQEPEPETVPLHKPEPLPDGVLGYVVVLRGDYRTGLADSDLRPTIGEARSDAKAHGKRPGWAGRAVACEVRVAPR